MIFSKHYLATGTLCLVLGFILASHSAPADAPPLKDAKVLPVRFEAEDWSDRGELPTADEAAYGGFGLAGNLSTRSIPFPQTSRPVDIYVRVKGRAGDRVMIFSRSGGESQKLREHAIKEDRWQWIRFSGFTAVEMGDSFYIQLRQSGDKPIFVDSILLTSGPEMSDAELDSVRTYDQRPFTTVGRAVSAPVIDGQGDDAAWQQAITFQPFLVGLEGAGPKAATTAQMMWDEGNLYVRFHCAEPILDPARNLLDNFQRTHSERDAVIWQDECVLLILRPPGSNEIYDFFVNANGTVNDARAPVAYAWSGRDTSYNPPVAVAAGVGDGFWEVEMAIPWAAVGGPPGIETWRACLGRARHAEAESSVWNPTPGGFHQPDYFGSIQFTDRPRALALELPERLTPTDNDIECRSNPNDFPLTVIWSSRPLTDGAISNQFRIVRNESAARWAFDIAETGRIIFSASLLDGATLQPLVLSGEMMRRVDASTATLQIATEGNWRVRVGEKVVATGSGAAKQVSLPLSEGANVVSISFDSGAGAFTGDFRGVPLVSDDTWVMTGVELPERFYESDFDDSDLPRAQILGDSTLAEAQLVGLETGPVTLRKTLLWRHLRLWPKPAPYLYIAQGCPQHLVFPNPGIPGRKLDDFRVHVAVPLGFEVLGATGYYGKATSTPIYAAAQAGTMVFDGEAYRVWEITSDKLVPYETQRHPVLHELDVFVRANKPSAEDVTPQIAYWLEAEHGAVIGAPQFVPVKVLPPLRGKQPAKLRWQLWRHFPHVMDNLETRRAVLEAARQAGSTEITGERDPEVCAELGLRRIEVSHFSLGGKRLKNVIKEHPEYLQVDFDGNRSQTYLSPAYLLDEAWPYFEEHLRETVLRYKPETLLYDIETNPWTGYFASYDERSLREFAEFAQIAAAGLTPQVIKEHHSEKWLAFVAQRCAQVCRKTKDAIHNILPGTELLVYSGYQSPDTLASLSVDWARIAALDAVDAACCGYGRNPKNLNATRKALGDIPLVTGALLSPYVLTEDRPLNYYSKAGLLRRLIDGTGGVLLYERLSFDGRCYEAVAEVSRLSADYEEIFLYGKLLEHWGDFGEAVMGDSAVLEHNGKHLIAIMNEHGQPGTYRFKLPETGFTKGTEYYSGQRVVPGQPIELQLEPGGVAAYVLE